MPSALKIILSILRLYSIIEEEEVYTPTTQVKMKSVKKRIGSEQRDFSVSDDMGGESLSDDSLDDVELSSTRSPPGTEKKTLSEAEQIKALYRSRVIIAVLLSLFTAAAGGVAFWMAKRAQETYFHEQVCWVSSNFFSLSLH